MTPRRNALAVLLLASICAAPASAHKIRPGLYENTSKIISGNPLGNSARQLQQGTMAEPAPEERERTADISKQMSQAIANMPPEQRKEMKEMLGKQGLDLESIQSMQVNVKPDGAVNMKLCVTKQMAERSEFLLQPQDSCKYKVGKFVGGVMKFSSTCAEPAATGEGEVRVTGPNTYATKMRVVMHEAGRQQTIVAEVVSKWLGADCGSVKPQASQR
ncbi:DUF3617 domain-containing protein [Massilia glaciei]|nr:DUF3617 domain-containing protein [Massilia glaciei]